jgi:hypothetical protein
MEEKSFSSSLCNKKKIRRVQMRTMKTVLLMSALIFIFFFARSSDAGAVRGYFRSNGTYVSQYQRTQPSSNPYKNYSFPGNYNPNKGKITRGNPDKYLERYYNRRNTK